MSQDAVRSVTMQHHAKMQHHATMGNGGEQHVGIIEVHRHNLHHAETLAGFEVRIVGVPQYRTSIGKCRQ